MHVSALLPISDVTDELTRQNKKWGQQNHADGTGPAVVVLGGISGHLSARSLALARALPIANAARVACDTVRPLTWRAILLEEVFEALAEDDEEGLRTELIQVAAVAVQWAAAIDRRTR